MKSPVKDMTVLCPALRTHIEVLHGGVLPVVGNLLDYGKARPAVGAVGEGIFEPPVVRVIYLFGALIAYRNVRKDGYPPLSLPFAFPDLKVLITGLFKKRMLHAIDLRDLRLLYVYPY
ncbi:hypothetical protein BMS3Abin09_00314 [bacterium BMS3Abin09]|nr:hypothetical protein BMS3Abin09_00314 [bacterium BMS3Abin09]